MIGVAAVPYSRLESWCAIVALTGIVSAAVIRRHVVVLLLFVCAVAIGNVYGAVSYIDMHRLDRLVNASVTVEGTIAEDVVPGRREVILELNNLKVGGYRAGGALRVTTAMRGDFKRGDEVRLSGILQPGFGTFVGTMNAESIQELVRPWPGDVGRMVRDWFAAAVRQAVPEPQASLGIGFLTGQQSSVPDALMELMRIAGLTHIVVASGYNLTILVRVARRLFIKHSKHATTLASAVMIGGFMAVTGLSPSMTRAGLVSGLSVLCWYYGRTMHPFVLLPFVAALTVLWQPSFAWNDLGWQLSFAAFIGVMVVAPLMARYFFGDKPPGLIGQVIGETVAAHIVTLPIVALAFGTVSHVAIIANVLIVPLVPLAMLLTFIVGVVVLLMPFLSDVIGWGVVWVLTYMVELATFLSGLPWAQSQIEPEPWMAIVYGVGLAMACLWMWRATRFSFRDVSIID